MTTIITKTKSITILDFHKRSDNEEIIMKVLSICLTLSINRVKANKGNN